MKTLNDNIETYEVNDSQKAIEDARERYWAR